MMTRLWLAKIASRAHGVVVSHPLRMRKALGSNPSGSIVAACGCSLAGTRLVCRACQHLSSAARNFSKHKPVGMIFETNDQP
jgi:hypothetical protein